MITVLLADDHPLLLRGIADLLRPEQDFHIIATATAGAQALEMIRAHQPMLAVLDVAMGDFGGMEILRAVRRDGLKVGIIFLTASLTSQQIGEALSLGVNGLLLKESATGTLIDCMRQVARGGKWVPADILAKAEPAWQGTTWQGTRRPTLDTLTPREREIVDWVCRGLSNKAIAVKLGTSQGTVKVHLHNIYQKLGIANRMSLAALNFQADDGPMGRNGHPHA